MDISSLLSPQDVPVRQTPLPPAPAQAQAQAQTQAHATPRKRAGRGSKRTASSLSQEIVPSPSPSPQTAGEQHPPRSTPHFGYDAISQAEHAVASSAYSTTTSFRPLGTTIGAPTSDPRTPFATAQLSQNQDVTRPSQALHHRHSSTPQMETLADLASMQHHQQTVRQNSNGVRSTDVVEAQRSPSNITLQSRPSVNHSLSASSRDLAMADAPSQTPPPRAYTAASLSAADLQQVTELTSYLVENSYSYESHVKLINILHRGLLSHVYPDHADEPGGNPLDYSLLPDLRQARDAMESRFAVGELLWIDWIRDECMIARSPEERVAAQELCQRALVDEPASVTLHELYAEWMWTIYAAANDLPGWTDVDLGTDEDKMILRELFNRDLVYGIWDNAVAATSWRIDAGHRIWKRYLEIIMQGFPESPSPDDIDRIKMLYMSRLQLPQATWEETFNDFWAFISRYDEQHWEEIAVATNTEAAMAKQQYALRDLCELRLSRALESGSDMAASAAFAEYLEWEKTHKSPKAYKAMDAELLSALYERALLQFPTNVDLWLDYYDHLTLKSTPNATLLLLLERATRHCPWCGDLWARRLLRSEVEKKDYAETGEIKHKATKSGLLDVGGLEEMMKVYIAWCGYLRRRAFAQNATEDELDMADMGIISAFEDIQEMGEKIYGKDFTGDPHYRIERIYIKHLSQARRTEPARAAWRKLIPRQQHFHDFWLRYYQWEIFIWAFQRMAEQHRIENDQNGPHAATNVLREAIRPKHLDAMDWPEKLLESYQAHFEHHESPGELQRAMAEVRVATKRVQDRRAKEAADAADAANMSAPAATVAPTAVKVTTEVPMEEPVYQTKRKREEESVVTSEVASKRSRSEAPEAVQNLGDPSPSATSQPKRDREHATISVTDLPSDVTDLRLRQFFRDCGKINNAKIVNGTEGQAASAIVEFETGEDMLSALTKRGKLLDGKKIGIQGGTTSTLYVTNFPPEADEKWIRGLFGDYGEIVEVRFPSLKYKANRRFCYVQFLKAEQAHRASDELDEKVLDGQHRLLAKISDPAAKKTREGAQTEGREIYVNNLDWQADEADVEAFFGEVGKVERVRIPRKFGGGSKGHAFIIFATKEDAQAALALHQKPYRKRLLNVQISSKDHDKGGYKPPKGVKNIFDHAGITSASPAPTAGSPPADAEAETADLGATEQDPRALTTVTTIPMHIQHDEGTRFTRKERSIALLGLPDTVNDARVRAVMEPFGALRKIFLRPDKGCATVEFVDAHDAGKAGLADFSALGEGVRVGAVEEAFAIRGRQVETVEAAQDDKVDAKGKAGVTDKSLLFRPTSTFISRPQQRGGRRGGLGFKSVGAGFGGTRAADGAAAQKGEAHGAVKQGTAKNNDSFRKMFEASVGTEKEKPDEEDEE
ncbi:Splicing factor [Elasticomyces elasticus]|nr:Splicing factor [Elasticomyces elasticus]